ncbi:MAG: hypothetical protein CO128_00655 [Ignavibacteriales bacterium CG_4_9_14_3_um_filter_30_11]|nr:zf-HC2 domain-containing protein [Ignavibacteria bacterium]PJB00401.1 MAG: hypothetical protein CO128_00655 [Ignavibacteriales bacterium CG_4_9_14_3_um_filter_30_11]
MKKQKITCKEVSDHICESLGEELDSPRCIAIKKHLNSCPNCQNYFTSIEKTIDFYKKYNLELPKDSHNKLINLLNLSCE